MGTHIATRRSLALVAGILSTIAISFIVLTPVEASEASSIVSTAGPDEAPPPPPDVYVAPSSTDYLVEAYGLAPAEAVERLSVVPAKRRLAPAGA